MSFRARAREFSGLLGHSRLRLSSVVIESDSATSRATRLHARCEGLCAPSSTQGAPVEEFSTAVAATWGRVLAQSCRTRCALRTGRCQPHSRSPSSSSSCPDINRSDLHLSQKRGAVGLVLGGRLRELEPNSDLWRSGAVVCLYLPLGSPVVPFTLFGVLGSLIK